MYRIMPNKAAETTIHLPASKSITHRLLILSALNQGKTEIKNPLYSEDTKITKNALQAMGGQIDDNGNTFKIHGPIGETKKQEIYLGNSGSSARFLLPLGSILNQPMRFYGVDRLHKRPFSELFDALKKLGADVDTTDSSLPATTRPAELKGGHIKFDNLPSSQIISGLMMSGLMMKEDLILSLPVKTPSLPYIIMTVNLMQRLRLNVYYSGNQVEVKAGQPCFDWLIAVEKDFSAASYWVLYALINQVKVILNGLSLPSLQGDEQILNIADQVGGHIMLYADHISIEGNIKHSFNIDCESTPDLVPALAVLALFCPSECVLKNVRVLEYKESNRIEALQENIRRIGGKSNYDGNDLTIMPQAEYQGNRIKSHNDHRIAMSFAIAGTRIAGITIDHPDCVSKSYPAFWRDFRYWIKQSEKNED